MFTFLRYFLVFLVKIFFFSGNKIVISRHEMKFFARKLLSFTIDLIFSKKAVISRREIARRTFDQTATIGWLGFATI